MELTPSFLALLQHFAPVFTAPTFLTFLRSPPAGSSPTAIVTSPR